ncbi:malonic semialdehyde reductase [Allostreptomyces psammosilenae]|uniref:Nitroreductase n=1 Tax=Allostreptomyces psammosilenae TaxID=1892865 RepID=A0A853ACG2_9ACTN|nr:malonic semialdehyde reductase [Allostreptomyces psammosilenae]NYI08052.1 nitroreductase [Allostreptomyces psammosilenae]
MSLPVLADDARALLFSEAHTANSFTDEPVTDEQIRTIHELFKFPPTAMNQQPLRVVLIGRNGNRDRLVPLLAEGNRKKTAAAPLVAVLAADLEFHEELPKVFPHFPGAKDLFADPAAREASAIANGWLQVGYFIMAVRAAGLAAGPMTGFDAAAATKEFFDDDHRALAVVNIGHPAEDAFRPRLPRLDFDEVVTVL